jgi:hypothetical protein
MKLVRYLLEIAPGDDRFSTFATSDNGKNDQKACKTNQ